MAQVALNVVITVPGNEDEAIAAAEEIQQTLIRMGKKVAYPYYIQQIAAGTPQIVHNKTIGTLNENNRETEVITVKLGDGNSL